jgi:hypothetical protein
MYLSCRRLIFSALTLAGLATSSFAQGDGDLVERGSQLATEAAAVLYEEDPAEPAGRRYVGSAAWRTETVTPETGQPPELAILADIAVPERKLALTLSLRRNTDRSLSATHTIEITFKLPADFAPGGISNVPGILMKLGQRVRGRAARLAVGQGHPERLSDGAVRVRAGHAEKPSVARTRLV